MLSGFLAKSYVSASLVGLVLASGEPRFYPSGCGGHKNLENVATFSKFLGGRKNLFSAHDLALARSYLHGHLTGGEIRPRAYLFTRNLGGRKNLFSAHMFLPAHKLAFAGDFYLYRK